MGGGPAPSRPGDLQPELVLYSTELRAAAAKIPVSGLGGKRTWRWIPVIALR